MSSSANFALVVPLTVALAVAVRVPGTAAAADLELGEYLAAECTSCHQPSGEDRGIPSIVGWSAPALVAVLGQYRDGSRDHAIMQSVARGLAEDEVEALAAYFAQLSPSKTGDKTQ